MRRSERLTFSHMGSSFESSTDSLSSTVWSPENNNRSLNNGFLVQRNLKSNRGRRNF